MGWASAIRAIIFLCLPTVALAAEQKGPGQVHWRSEGASPRMRKADAKASAAFLDATQDKHIVVQFDKLPGPGERAKLKDKGVRLLRYLGNNAYFARVDGRKAPGAQAVKAGLRDAFEIKPEWKLHSRLIRGELPAYARIPADVAGVPGAKERKKANARQGKQTTEAIAALYVLFQSDVDQAQATAVVGRYGGTIRSWLRSINAAVVWVPSDLVQALAAEDDVQWVEPPLPPLAVSNNSVRARTQVDYVRENLGLTGAGISVMVYDGGTALTTHADFGGRVFARDDTSANDHPTHVAGIIGGSGLLSDGLYRGMAPDVTIQSFGFEYDGTAQFLYTNPGDLESDYSKAINNFDAVVANNSIGTNVALNGYTCDWEGDYGVTSMLIDAIVRGSLGPPMRVVWANGNERGSGRCGVEFHTTAPPACAKNIISVGALNSNDDTMTTFSSWGPTDDGRLKPDLCAPGCQSDDDQGVTSTVILGDYGTMCGTSMAAPVVTGLAAVILQDWKLQFPDQPLPPNAMLKVLLAHNAQDLGTDGPDYRFGYGSVRLNDTISFLNSRSFTQGTVDQDGWVVNYVSVSSSLSPLKVTLAWDDPPGAVNSSIELVNDLDLKVISPSGVQYFPWTLDPNVPAAAAVRTKPDHINNIEQVVVDSPETGMWTVLVTGTSVPSGPQDFSLASTPTLQTCASAGMLLMDRSRYGCGSAVQLLLSDCDLNTDPNTVQAAEVTVKSGSDPVGRVLTLTEISPDSATFAGSCLLSSESNPETLLVNNGDTITASYLDADDGAGHQNVIVSKSAEIDCAPPTISTPQVTNITSESAVVSFTTDEPALVRLQYGDSCASATQTVKGGDYVTEHNLTLSRLVKNTTYYFKVAAEDEALNTTTLDNGGACYTFTTDDRQSYFTQQFVSNGPTFDLANKCLTFVPADNIHGYLASLDSISELPASLDGATSLPLSDDAFMKIDLADNKTVLLYGVSYGSMYVGSNGFVTFATGDTEYTENLTDHFSQPRVSVLFDDFNPNPDRVKYQQLSDRIVVTWLNVPEYGIINSSTFQLVMRFDGTIQLAWLGVDSIDGIVGLSKGEGVPVNFKAEDLSASPLCNGLPERAFGSSPWPGAIDVPALTTLTWQSGMHADSHEIYFGADPGNLEFQTTQSANSFALPDLVDNTTYYWRVDEVNSLGRTGGEVWSFTTKRLKPDFDNDGDVDMTDFGHLQLCLSGADVPQTRPECQDAKLDNDDDVDDADASLLEGCLTGAGQLGRASCLP